MPGKTAMDADRESLFTCSVPPLESFVRGTRES